LRRFRQFLRNNFFSGLLVTVPFAVTIACLAWIWQQIDGRLSSFFEFITGAQSNEGPWAKLYHGITQSVFGEMIVPILGLALIFLLIVTVGLVIRSIVGRYVLNSVEAAISRLPVVGMLYGSIKQLGESFISGDGQSKFQRAVAVQFPCPGTWAIGFVTGPGDNVLRFVPKEKNALNTTPMLTVFVPTTPLPTAGFTLVVPVAETMDLEMSVPDALRMVVSGGMISPNDNRKLAVEKSSPAAQPPSFPAPQESRAGGTSEKLSPMQDSAVINTSI
jgi:uncharacterized membrane protein